MNISVFGIRKWAVLLAAAAVVIASGDAAAYEIGPLNTSESPVGIHMPSERMFSGGDGNVHRSGHDWRRKQAQCFGMNDTHRQTYLLLLAEKYAPSTVPEWKKTLAETDRLKQALRSRIRSGRLDERKQQADSGSPSVPAPPQVGGKDGHSHHDKKLQNARERWRTAMRTFDEAVRSGKPDNIRNALNGLLEQNKLRNEMLKSKLESTVTKSLS